MCGSRRHRPVWRHQLGYPEDRVVPVSSASIQGQGEGSFTEMVLTYSMKLLSDRCCWILVTPTCTGPRDDHSGRRVAAVHWHVRWFRRSVSVRFHRVQHRVVFGRNSCDRITSWAPPISTRERELLRGKPCSLRLSFLTVLQHRGTGAIVPTACTCCRHRLVVQSCGPHECGINHTRTAWCRTASVSQNPAVFTPVAAENPKSNVLVAFTRPHNVHANPRRVTGSLCGLVYVQRYGRIHVRVVSDM
jgi:hypothetical protein